MTAAPLKLQKGDLVRYQSRRGKIVIEGPILAIRHMKQTGKVYYSVGFMSGLTDKDLELIERVKR